MNESREIISYSGPSTIVTVAPPFTTTPSGYYELLQWSRNNEIHFPFTASTASLREAVCYDVELINIELPNILLQSGHGGRAVYYPFFYVKLSPVNKSEGPYFLSSNNPHAVGKLFRVVIDDSISYQNSPFIRVDGNGMVQRIKLNPADGFEFGVYLPDGSLFRTMDQDYYSPCPPNYMVQISALFKFTRVSAQC